LEALGIYAHSQTYATVFKAVNKAFARAVNPPALRAFAEGLDTNFLVAQFRIWFALLALVGVATVAFSRDMLAFLTHNKFVDAAPLVVVWVFLMVSHSVGIPNAQFLLSRKATGTLAYLQTAISVVFIGVTAAATYFFGIYGACISIVASNLILQTAYVLRASKMGCQYRDSAFALVPAILIIVCATFDHFFQFAFYQRVLFVMVFSAAVAGYVNFQFKALADGQPLVRRA
jgi:O-antigen/teichoic acid export membrane protein